MQSCAVVTASFARARAQYLAKAHPARHIMAYAPAGVQYGSACATRLLEIMESCAWAYAASAAAIMYFPRVRRRALNQAENSEKSAFLAAPAARSCGVVYHHQRYIGLAASARRCRAAASINVCRHHQCRILRKSPFSVARIFMAPK